MGETVAERGRREVRRTVIDAEALQRLDPSAWRRHYADLVEMADAFLNRNYAGIPHRGDVRDEAISRLFRAVPRLRDPGRFRPFFYELLCRTANETLRLAKRRQEAERIHERIHRVADHAAPTPEEAAMLLLDLKRAFGGLSRLHQEICALRFQNLTWERIGKALSRSYKSLAREFQRLNQVLENSLHPEVLHRHPRMVTHFFEERARELFGEDRLATLLTDDPAPDWTSEPVALGETVR